MKLIPIKMQNIIAKKMTAFNSDALGTINDNNRSLLHQQLCRTKHEQFKFKGLISAASTTSSRMKWYFHFRFCHVFNSCLSMHQILIEKKLFDSLWIFLHSWKQLYWTVFIQVPKLSLCGILWRCSIKGGKNLHPQCIFAWDEIMN